MNEADFKTTVAIIKTDAEAGVPLGEVEGRVRAALHGITDTIEAAFERAAGEFRAEGDALFAEADELRRFQEVRRTPEAEIHALPPDLWGGIGDSRQRQESGGANSRMTSTSECFSTVSTKSGTKKGSDDWRASSGGRHFQAAPARRWSAGDIRCARSGRPGS
jgi:hypothetical protein